MPTNDNIIVVPANEGSAVVKTPINRKVVAAVIGGAILTVVAGLLIAKTLTPADVVDAD